MNHKDIERNDRIIQLRKEGHKYDEIVPIIEKEFNQKLSNSRVHQIYNSKILPKKKIIDSKDTLFINLKEIPQKQIIIKIGGRIITIS